MTDKSYINLIKKDLVLIHSNISNMEYNDVEMLLHAVIYGIDQHLKNDGKKNKKYKSNIEKEMIEERIYPEDYYQRAKYILSRIKFHYPNYKISFVHMKATKKQKYMGIPPFEFWAIKDDLQFLTLAFKTNMKEFKDIFTDHYLNRLSLSKCAGKHFGDAGKAEKKRAENLNNRFCSAFAKALELKDLTEAKNNTVKIENKEFEMYKLLKEMDIGRAEKS